MFITATDPRFIENAKFLEVPRVLHARVGVWTHVIIESRVQNQVKMYNNYVLSVVKKKY